MNKFNIDDHTVCIIRMYLSTIASVCIYDHICMYLRSYLYLWRFFISLFFRVLIIKHLLFFICHKLLISIPTSVPTSRPTPKPTIAPTNKKAAKKSSKNQLWLLFLVPVVGLLVTLALTLKMCWVRKEKPNFIY